MSITDDPTDPRLSRGVDSKPRPQSEVYLVLTESERAKRFVRPYRDSYKHVGAAGPTYPLRDLTTDELKRYEQYGYLKYEAYPESESSVVGKFWTQATLNKVGKGCGTVTSMGRELSETYARQPDFYGSTYCCGCRMHLPVAEFVWTADGTRVGS